MFAMVPLFLSVKCLQLEAPFQNGEKLEKY